MLVKKYRPDIILKTINRLSEELKIEIDKQILTNLGYATKKVWKWYNHYEEVYDVF
jgi:hypothetical protein